jgi:hypothetical protein
VTWPSSRRLPTGSRSSRGSLRSRAGPGTIRRWSATSCWCATARRWLRSGWVLQADGSHADDAGTERNSDTRWLFV